MQCIRTCCCVGVFGLLILAPAIGTQSCKGSGNKKCLVGTPVTLKASDSTAPDAVMGAHFSDGSPALEVTPRTSPLTGKLKGTVTLLVSGNDPEGVKDIQIWVEETRWFTDPNTGRDTIERPLSATVPELNNPDNASVGQTVCTSRLTSLNLDLQQRRKGASKLEIRTWAQAVNFSGANARTKDIVLTWP